MPFYELVVDTTITRKITIEAETPEIAGMCVLSDDIDDEAVWRDISEDKKIVSGKEVIYEDIDLDKFNSEVKDAF